MNSRLPLTLLFSALVLAVPAVAQSSLHPQGHGATPTASQKGAQKGELVPVTEKEAAWAAEARKQYPLTTCVVSGEALGSMGEPDAYIYRVAGQPDRLVLFCCSGCEEDFMADPAAHLAKLEEGRKSAGKKQGSGSGHGHHQH